MAASAPTTQPPSDEVGPNADPLAAALQKLRRAIGVQRVDDICAAYRALRRAAAGVGLREAFRRMDEALGSAGRRAVVAAFSHLHCFMCNRGLAPCEACDGRGTDEAGGPCEACDGLGAGPCEFCGGSGWISRDQIPPELRRAVTAVQYRRTEKELADLAHRLHDAEHVRQARREAKARRDLGGRLMRLRGRVEDLAEAPNLPDDADRQRLEKQAEQLGRALDALRVAD